MSDYPLAVRPPAPGLLLQFSQVCFRVLALTLGITSNVLGFFADALYQASMMAAHLGGLELPNE